MNIKQQLIALLESIDKDASIFSLDKREEIGTLFESTFNEKVEAAVAEVDEQNTKELSDLIELFKTKETEALAAQDSDYADKTEELLDLQDADYADKAEELLDLQDADYADKTEELLTLQDADYATKTEEIISIVKGLKPEEADVSELEATIEALEAKVTELETPAEEDEDEEEDEETPDVEEDEEDEEVVEESKESKESKIMSEEDMEDLVESIDEQLENFLDTEQGGVLVQQEKYDKAMKAIDTIKDMLVLTDEDTEEAINAKEEELQEALKENTRLKTDKESMISESVNKRKLFEAKKLLESKVKGYDRTKQLYLKQMFKGRQSAYITEKMDEVAEAYDKELHESRYTAKLAKREETPLYVDTVLSESTLSDENETVDGPDMSQYINAVSAMDQYI